MKWADRVLYSVVKCHHYLSQQLICWSKLPDISSPVQGSPIFSPNHTAAVVAEWLRRLTRNQTMWSVELCSQSRVSSKFTPIFRHSSVSAVVAEWLRRLTRNQMGSARAGSNPADCEFFFKDCCTDC